MKGNILRFFCGEFGSDGRDVVAGSKSRFILEEQIVLIQNIEQNFADEIQVSTRIPNGLKDNSIRQGLLSNISLVCLIPGRSHKTCANS